jgi:YgiT-type zinc finger domain-containing protein
MICANCGKKTAKPCKSTRMFESGRTTFLVEGVPEVWCTSCGERYMTLDTLKRLEHIKREWRTLTVKKPIPVARFGGAA